jgi:hypothetical protein
MLKNSASGVLVSLRNSEALEGIFRSPRVIIWTNGHTKCGWYLLASSLTTALLDGHFEHPDPVLESAPYEIFLRHFVYKLSFSGSLPGDQRGLARIIHEPSAASADSLLRQTVSPFSASTYCTSMPQRFTPPSACLVSRLHAFATNLHE